MYLSATKCKKSFMGGGMWGVDDTTEGQDDVLSER